MPTIRQVTPFLLVPDFDAALDFFSRVLGFRVQYTWENVRMPNGDWLTFGQHIGS
jgi:catechol 2,3-dioxygenase-like lactoylglutathione lyase family enzyme